MKNKGQTKSWESYHIYYTGQGDVILKTLIIPYLERLADHFAFSPPFFFVRYYEDGYHIRLRLWLSDAEKEHANRLLTEMIQIGHSEKEIKISVISITYVPEIGRYGNEYTLNLAEKQFEQSSRIVLNWLKVHDSICLSERYLQALKMHIIFFKGIAIANDQALKVCERFIRCWLPRLYQNDVDATLQSARLLSHFQLEYLKYEPVLRQVLPGYWNSADGLDEDQLQNYLAIHQSILSAYTRAGIETEKIRGVLGSFMHMTNNRLGLSNNDEAFIIYLVSKSLIIIDQYENNG